MTKRMKKYLILSLIVLFILFIIIVLQKINFDYHFLGKSFDLAPTWLDNENIVFVRIGGYYNGIIYKYNIRKKSFVKLYKLMPPLEFFQGTVLLKMNFREYNEIYIEPDVTLNLTSRRISNLNFPDEVRKKIRSYRICDGDRLVFDESEISNNLYSIKYGVFNNRTGKIKRIKIGEFRLNEKLTEYHIGHNPWMANNRDIIMFSISNYRDKKTFFSMYDIENGKKLLEQVYDGILTSHIYIPSKDIIISYGDEKNNSIQPKNIQI